LMLRLGIGLIVGALFNGQGRSSSFNASFPTTSAMFIACFACNLDTIMETLLQAPRARSLLRREFLNGLYSCEAYFAAFMSANLIISFANTLALVVPLYLLVGFAATFTKLLIFLCALCIMTVIGMTVGLAIGCFARDFDEARNFLMPSLAPQMIFSGYILPYKNIPSYFKFLYYASFWQYCLGILQINEFEGRLYTEDCPAEQVVDMIEEFVKEHNSTLGPLIPPWFPTHTIPLNCTGVKTLEAAGLYPVRFGGLHGYFLILLGYMLGFSVIAYGSLKWSLYTITRDN